MHRKHNQHQHREGHLVRRPARLSYANAAATLALFFALTGTATAAVLLPRDSVGAEQIQADAVRSSGLVQSDTTIIDEVPYIGEGTGQEDGSGPLDAPISERIVLTAIVATAPDVDSTTIAVRCTEASGLGFHVDWDSGKLTAIEVKDEAQTD